MDLRCSTPPPPSSDEDDEDDDATTTFLAGALPDVDDALVMTHVPRRLVFAPLLFVCFLSSPLPEKKSLADTTRAPRHPSRPPRPRSCSCTRRATMPLHSSALPLFLCDTKETAIVALADECEHKFIILY